MKKAFATAGMAAALLVPSSGSVATAQEPITVWVGSCVIVIDAGTYSWNPPWGPISAEGPTVTRYNCPV